MVGFGGEVHQVTDFWLITSVSLVPVVCTIEVVDLLRIQRLYLCGDFAYTMVDTIDAVASLILASIPIRTSTSNPVASPVEVSYITSAFVCCPVTVPISVSVFYVLINYCHFGRVLLGSNLIN